MCESEASTAREIGTLHWGCTNSGTDERSLFALEKVEFMSGVQEMAFPGPLRAPVRGART